MGFHLVMLTIKTRSASLAGSDMTTQRWLSKSSPGSSTTNGKATRVAVGTAPTHAVLGQVAGPPISTDPPSATVVVDLNVPETV